MEHKDQLSEDEVLAIISSVMDTPKGDGLKYDHGKLDVTLVPSEAVRAIARVMTYGLSIGYKKDSWKEVKPDRYRAALYRHCLDYIDDQNHVDEESGLPTIEHILCNAAFLVWKAKNDA